MKALYQPAFCFHKTIDARFRSSRDLGRTRQLGWGGSSPYSGTSFALVPSCLLLFLHKYLQFFEIQSVGLSNISWAANASSTPTSSSSWNFHLSQQFYITPSTSPAPNSSSFKTAGPESSLHKSRYLNGKIQCLWAMIFQTSLPLGKIHQSLSATASLRIRASSTSGSPSKVLSRFSITCLSPPESCKSIEQFKFSEVQHASSEAGSIRKSVEEAAHLSDGCIQDAEDFQYP
jgi:hypothetical protein